MGKSVFVSHRISSILSNSVLLWSCQLPVTKGDPLYDANDNTSRCLYSDEISFFIVSVPFFEIFNEWHSCVAGRPKQNKIPKFEKELHAPCSKLKDKSPIFVSLQPINLLICKILSKRNQFLLYLPVAFDTILRWHNFRHSTLQNTNPKLQCQCRKLSRYHHQNFLNQRFILSYDFTYQKVLFWQNKNSDENCNMCSF